MSDELAKALHDAYWVATIGAMPDLWEKLPADSSAKKGYLAAAQAAREFYKISPRAERGAVWKIVEKCVAYVAACSESGDCRVCTKSDTCLAHEVVETLGFTIPEAHLTMEEEVHGE